MPTKMRKCVQCGCTESLSCKGGCAWSERDPKHCTNCEAENDIVAAIRKRPHATMEIGEWLARLMPDGVWPDLTDDALADAIVGAATRSAR